MLQYLALALFGAVMIVSVAAIVATIKAELPYILRALGIDSAPLPPLRPTGERRVRITRQARPAPPAAFRAAA